MTVLEGWVTGPANLFQLLLMDGLRGRRALAVRVGGSLLLGFPLLFVPMAPRMRGAGLTLLVLFVGLFGAVVSNARLRSEGQWQRLRLLPLGRWSLALDGVAAGAALDLVQTAPLLTLFLALHGGRLQVAAVAGFWCATLLFANALGMLIAACVRTSAEAHLGGALAVGGVALVSGLFPVPERIAPAVAWVAPLLPPRHFLVALAGDGWVGRGVGQGRAGMLLLGLASLWMVCRALNLSAPWQGPHSRRRR